jgi:hypothetical protein
LKPPQPLDGVVNQVLDFLDLVLAPTQIFDAFLNRFDAARPITVAVISVPIAVAVATVVIPVTHWSPPS